MCAATTLSNSQVGQALIDQAKEQNKAKDNVNVDREDISSIALPSANKFSVAAKESAPNKTEDLRETLRKQWEVAEREQAAFKKENPKLSKTIEQLEAIGLNVYVTQEDGTLRINVRDNQGIFLGGFNIESEKAAANPDSWDKDLTNEVNKILLKDGRNSVERWAGRQPRNSIIPPSAVREAETAEGMVEDIVNPRPESSAQSIVEGIVSSQQGREQDWKKQEERIIEAVTRLLDSKSIEIDGSSLRVNPLSTNYRTFERAKELGFEVRKVEGAEDLYQVYHNGEKTDWAISTASQNGVPQSEKEIIAKIATQLDKFLPNEIPIDVRGFDAGKEKFTPQPSAHLFSKALSPETPIESITQLPSSVASVQVHHPEGATAAEKQKPGRVLIHVRQMHGASALEDPSALPADLRADLERYLPKAQAQLSQILTAFSQGNVASGIYAEGMDPRTAASYRQNLAVLSDPGTRQSVANLEQAFQTKTAKDTAVKLRQIQLRFPEPRDAQVNKLVNAMEFLHDYQQLRETVQKDPILSSIARGQFQLYPGENEKIHQENIDYVNQHPDASVDDPKMAALMDKRDSHLVETVGNSQAEVSLAVLGAGHDLKAEVDAWNKKHPDDPITLVEVEPTAVTAYLNKENGNSRGVKGIAVR